MTKTYEVVVDWVNKENDKYMCVCAPLLEDMVYTLTIDGARIHVPIMAVNSIAVRTDGK